MENAGKFCSLKEGEALMNLIAIDIGNKNVKIGLFVEARFESGEVVPADDHQRILDTLSNFRDKIPLPESSEEYFTEAAVVASSVNPASTEEIRQIVREELERDLLLIGKDIPLSVELSVENPETVGTDRVLTACAAYAVAEKAVVIADFGTAVTIDLVDDRGVFTGGAIIPGFEISAKALHEQTAQLPEIKVEKPELPWGKNTEQAIKAGLYYSAIGTLEEIVRRYAEKIGTWPRTIVTGSDAEVIKEDCPFVDSYVPHLVIKGIALAYRKYIDQQEHKP